MRPICLAFCSVNQSALSVPGGDAERGGIRVGTSYSAERTAADWKTPDAVRSGFGEPERAVGTVGDAERLRVAGKLDIA